MDLKKGLKNRILVISILTLISLGVTGVQSLQAKMFQNNGYFVLLKGIFSSEPVLLKNGELFFPGGGTWPATGNIDSAKLYDLKTKKFSLVGSNLNILRGNYSTVLLADGRVLILGGNCLDKRGNVGKDTKYAEIYNPSTKTFSRISDMNYPRGFETYCLLLKDGRILIASPELPIETFNPTTEKFEVVGNIRKVDRSGRMPNWIVEFSTINNFYNVRPVLLKDSRVLLVGASHENTGNAEIFDPKTNSFITTGQMKYSRSSFTATLLNDGRVLIAGGDLKGPGFSGMSSSEIFDPKTKSFTDGGKLNIKRYNHSAILLSNGKVLVVNGGYERTGDIKELREAELFNPKTNKFEKIGLTHKTRSYPDMINISKNQVFISGGYAEIYKY